MEKYSEEMLGQIEELKILAAENRLKKSLSKLWKSFKGWNKKEMDSHALATQIRQWYFINKEKEGFTTGSDPGLPIAKALTEGYLREKDIDPELLSRLELLIQIMKV